MPGKSWSDPANRWLATTDDETTTFGIGGRIDLVPDRLMLNGDLAYSLGTVNIDYSGYGASQPLTTTYYAFRSPDEASNRQRTNSAPVIGSYCCGISGLGFE